MSTVFMASFYIVLDINECLNSSLHNCHSDATCNDTDGSFSCMCNQGFFGDGVDCMSKYYIIHNIM